MVTTTKGAPARTPGPEPAHASGTSDRERALAHLCDFECRVLPGALRRLSVWKNLGWEAARELSEEVRQELRLDVLQHTARILDLSEHERHDRWMRLVSHRLYHDRVRAQRKRARVEPDAGGGSTRAGGEHALITSEEFRGLLDRFSPGTRRVLAAVVDGGGARHGNGKVSIEATADALGLSRRTMSAMLAEARQRTVDAVSGRIASWRLRLAEALVGLAADRLRLGRGLRIDEAGRDVPCPEQRLRRVRRAARRLHSMHRHIPGLADVTLDVGLDTPPRELLALAARIAPSPLPTEPLWTFEAALAEGRLAEAAEALRRVPRHSVPPQAVPRVLARARLLEARGLPAAATSLLRRAVRRHPADARLRRSLVRICPPPPRIGPAGL